eukprot:TRINITY_DN219_c0_g1_i1.p1 TRINITY_DN219_c0_g1~~TRINITY_DN219_c0_g1_i1.p1  ORF type:complete len:829 (-),score=110.77 TRINITY_DN219_c0_g1_i1:62-2269(-)
MAGQWSTGTPGGYLLNPMNDTGCPNPFPFTATRGYSINGGGDASLTFETRTAYSTGVPRRTCSPTGYRAVYPLNADTFYGDFGWQGPVHIYTTAPVVTSITLSSPAVFTSAPVNQTFVVDGDNIPFANETAISAQLVYTSMPYTNTNCSNSTVSVVGFSSVGSNELLQIKYSVSNYISGCMVVLGYVSYGDGQGSVSIANSTYPGTVAVTVDIPIINQNTSQSLPAAGGQSIFISGSSLPTNQSEVFSVSFLASAPCSGSVVPSDVTIVPGGIVATVDLSAVGGGYLSCNILAKVTRFDAPFTVSSPSTLVASIPRLIPVSGGTDNFGNGPLGAGTYSLAVFNGYWAGLQPAIVDGRMAGQWSTGTPGGYLLNTMNDAGCPNPFPFTATRGYSINGGGVASLTFETRTAYSTGVPRRTCSPTGYRAVYPLNADTFYGDFGWQGPVHIYTTAPVVTSITLSSPAVFTSAPVNQTFVVDGDNIPFANETAISAQLVYTSMPYTNTNCSNSTVSVVGFSSVGPNELLQIKYSVSNYISGCMVVLDYVSYGDGQGSVSISDGNATYPAIVALTVDAPRITQNTSQNINAASNQTIFISGSNLPTNQSEVFSVSFSASAPCSGSVGAIGVTIVPGGITATIDTSEVVGSLSCGVSAQVTRFSGVFAISSSPSTVATSIRPPPPVAPPVAEPPVASSPVAASPSVRAPTLAASPKISTSSSILPTSALCSIISLILASILM